MENDQPTKLRVMVDANILFAGVLWPRFPYEVLRSATTGNYQLVLAQYIIAEAQKAIQRLDVTALGRLEEILEDSHFEEVPSPTDIEIAAHPDLVRDTKDIAVALSAINAKVDYLISMDKDLTDPAEPIHAHLKILLPAKFLREHMGWTSEAIEAIRHRNWDDLK